MTGTIGLERGLEIVPAPGTVIDRASPRQPS